jgi:two-component system, LytTR family, sensor kinase
VFTVKYRLLYIALLSAYSFLNILYTVGNEFFDFHLPKSYLLIILTAVVLGVWELNRLVNLKIPEQPLVLGKKIHPLILLFLASMLNVVLVSTASLFLLYAAMGMKPTITATHFTLLTAFGFRVNLFLNCVNAIVFFMNKLKKTQIEAEQHKQQSIEAQFEVLRNQINPHFLFNSFNVLASLVYKDADASAKFIEQLSTVYRYLLSSRDKKIVQLKEEMDFIEAYLYLLTIRFGKNLVLEQRIEEEGLAKFLPPASLQLLIENAIKHNVISRKESLYLSIATEGDYLIVSNTLHEKQDKEPSTNIGLKNIESRYAFLTNNKMEVLKTTDRFTVKLPLLQVEHHEYFNR